MRRVLLLFPLLLACNPGTNDLVINEFVASNASGLPDESGAFPDWIELLNRTEDTLDLGEFAISDDPDEPLRHAFPMGLEVEAGGYLVLFADGDVADGPEHLSFKLSAGGEDLLVHRVIDGEPVLEDWVTFDQQTTDVSSARQPDGTGGFVEDATPTPGAPNDG